METPATLTIDDLRTTLARWRSEAQNACVTTAHPTDLEWLSGRIRALGDVLDLLGQAHEPPRD